MFHWISTVGLVAVMTAFSSKAGICAQLGPVRTIETSKGVVEFIGLEKWTPKLIQEKLGYNSVDRLHYCASDLKKIGFPDAAVTVANDHGVHYTIITVVEPERAKDVVHLPRPNGHDPLPASWADLPTIVKQSTFLEGGVLDYPRAFPGARIDLPPLADGNSQKWWPEMRTHTREGDYVAARKLLSSASDPAYRAVAALVLMNFHENDEAWQALVRGLRDPDDLVNSTCLQALNSLATFLPRKVDWAPAQQDIGHVLRGTNLFAFPFLLKALTATLVDPKLAEPLLRNGGGRLVLAFLQATTQTERDLASRFLVQLHGSDLGGDPAVWQKWVASL